MRTLRSARHAPLALALALALAAPACARPQTAKPASQRAGGATGAGVGSAAAANHPAAAAAANHPAARHAAAPTAGKQGTSKRATSRTTARAPMVSKTDPQYDHVEGTHLNNACSTDSDCHVGGCAAEICSAAKHAISPCIMPRGGWASKGGTCGCVKGRCIWYRTRKSRSGGQSSSRPKLGERCDHGACAKGLTCVSYYGIAGRRGPKLSSCEIRCGAKHPACPKGLTCVTIADGPGRVCRPVKSRPRR